jgi:hypothetical protein
MNPILILRLESAVWFLLSLYFYHSIGGSWWKFMALFLVPDLSLLGYFISKRCGTLCYNAMHTTLVPVSLIVLGMISNFEYFFMGVIWFIHIELDRALGLGLKSQSGFFNTHLSKIERPQSH